MVRRLLEHQESAFELQNQGEVAGVAVSAVVSSLSAKSYVTTEPDAEHTIIEDAAKGYGPNRATYLPSWSLCQYTRNRWYIIHLELPRSQELWCSSCGRQVSVIEAGKSVL